MNQVSLQCLILLVTTLLAGCSTRDRLSQAPVSGTVTRQGRPVDHGQVVFTPQEGTAGPQAVGQIHPDGRFRMETAGRTGAAIGKHRVTVHCRREVTPEEAARLVVGESLIPDRYWKEAESPLRFEVKEGNNECPLVLE